MSNEKTSIPRHGCRASMASLRGSLPECHGEPSMTVATPRDAGCVLRFRHGARFRCGCASSSNVREGCDAYEDQALLCVGRLQYSTTIYSMWLLGVARQEPSHRWKMRREVYNLPTMTCMTGSCFQRVFPCTKYSRVPRAIPLSAHDTPQLLPQPSSRFTLAGHDGFHWDCERT